MLLDSPDEYSYVYKLFFEGISPSTLLFGSYEVIHCIHASDTSGVYLCKYTKENTLRVLKVSEKKSDNPISYHMISREISITTNISHPSILTPLESFEDDEFIAFAMPYLTGGTLEDLIIEDAGVLPLQRALETLRGIASGLSNLHDNEIVHSDIKPSNILLDKYLKPKICDFGLSSRVSEKPLPFEDSLVGTLDYIAPEYLIHGEVLPSIDVYSLGILACEILTGKNPLAGVETYDTLRKRLHNVTCNLSELNPYVPRHLEDTINQCLSYNPKDRPTSKDFKNLLSANLEDVFLAH